MVAAVPVTPGWLLQVTPDSVQEEATRRAWSVRPLVAESEYKRSVADTTWVQPVGRAGSGKRTSPISNSLSKPVCLMPLVCNFPMISEVW